MNVKTTLILLVLLAIVGAYFFFVERGATTAYEREQASAQRSGQVGQPLFEAFDPAAVDQITLQQNGAAAVLRKSGDEWTQAEPVHFPLNNLQIRQLLSAARTLRYLERFVPGEDGVPTLEQAGLAPPRATITFGQGDDAYTIHLGRTSVGQHGYAQLVGDRNAYVVTTGLHEAVLEGGISAWRQRTLAGPSADAAQRILLQSPNAQIALIKHDGRWYLNDQHTERASADEVVGLINALNAVSIQDFVADQPADPAVFGLEAPTLVVQVMAAGVDGEPSQPRVLRVGAPADLESQNYFATWSTAEEPSPVVFTIAGSAVQSLTKSENELRDPRVVLSSPHEVQALHVRRPNLDDLHLIRDADAGFTWGGEAPPPYRVDFNDANRLVQSITKLQAQDYVDGFQAAGEPAAQLTLTLPAGATERVRLYPPEQGEGYLAVRNDETVAHRVAAEDVATLFEPRLALRDRELLHLPADQISQLTLQRSDGATFTLVRGEGAGWQLQSGEPVDESSVSTLINALAPLRVEQWLAEPVTPGDGWATLQIQTAAGETHQLHVDPQTRQGVMASLDTAFVLPAPVVATLEGELRKRTILSLPLEQIEAVTLTSGENTLTITRGSNGQYVDDQGAVLEQSAAGALFDTLAGLQVQRHVAPPAQAHPIERTLTIQTRDGETRQIDLFVGQAPQLARLGEIWFTLSSETAGKLGMDVEVLRQAR